MSSIPLPLPVTSMSVITPDSRVITMTGDPEIGQLRFTGLLQGPISLNGAEVWAVRQILNLVFHP